tara:strand:+ start:3466 stop:3918 length:453 start_codon:yes stop_codon:yes gene_type:complete
MLADGASCFVCGDEQGPLYRVCKCETLVHGACFTQLVARVRAHERACPVCTSEYRVRTRLALQRCDADRATYLVLGCVATLTLQVCAAVFLDWAVYDGGDQARVIAVVCILWDALVCAVCCSFQCALWTRTARHLVLPRPHVSPDAALSV